MAIADAARTQHVEHIVEGRFRIALPPRAAIAKRGGKAVIDVGGGYRAVTPQHSFQYIGIELRGDDSGEGVLEPRQFRFIQRQASRHRVATEAVDQARMQRVDAGDGITHVDARNRPRGTAQ